MRSKVACTSSAIVSTYEAPNQTWGDYSTNVIDYDYIESNHDYNCLETSSGRKQSPSVWFDV